MSQPPAPGPRSYLLVGPPDLLHDVLLDFAEIGWEVSASRWNAVVTAPAEDAGAPAPDWPSELTLAGVLDEDHASACRRHLQPEA